MAEQPTQPIKKLLTYEQAQARYQCGRRALYNQIKRGVIEAYQPADKVLIDQDSADTWFYSTKLKPVKRPGRPRRGAPRL